MYDRILVPLDGSPFAEQVLPLAAALARRSGMTLELVQVQRSHPVGYVQDTMLAALGIDAREREASAAYLDGVARRLSEDAGLVVRPTLLDAATPAEGICREAERTGATLLAMTTHGRTGLLRTVRGSVADGVLRHATLPVLLWRPGDPPPAPPTSPEHILATLDGSTWAETVLPVAAAIADAVGARLTLLRVVANVSAVAPAPVATIGGVPFAGLDYVPPVLDPHATRRAVDRAHGYLVHVADRIHADHPRLVVGTHALADDDAARTILRMLPEVHADVVAMSTHGRGTSRLIVGSTVDRVLRGRTGATLLVRPSLPVPRG